MQQRCGDERSKKSTREARDGCCGQVRADIFARRGGGKMGGRGSARRDILKRL